MKSVLLAGCGNIGFRHLQALCEMRTPAVITVVEPNTDHHDRIQKQFSDAADSHHRFELTKVLPDEPTTFDLVVVATGSMHRRSVVDGVLGRHQVAAMVLEKVLFQTTRDLDEVQSALADRQISCYVNCGRRTFNGYQHLRTSFLSDRPVNVIVRGARLGLASNAIHFLDLAEFLNDAEVVSIDADGLDAGSIGTRHAGCVDVFGSISAHLSNGATLDVESVDEAPSRIAVLLDTVEHSAVIDELARTLIIDGATTTPFESQNVSETYWLYDDLVTSTDSQLTPYADSARQHRLFLDSLRNHLRLSVERDEPCPIS